MQKGFVPIVIVLLIAVFLGIGGYFMYKNSQTKPSAPSPQPTTYFTPQPSPTPAAASPVLSGTGETANWKAISLDELSLKIPPTWWNRVREGVNGDPESNWVSINPTSLEKDIDTPPAFLITDVKKTLQQQKGEVTKNLTDVNIQNTTIAQKEAIIVSGMTPGGVLSPRKVKIALVLSNNTVYKFEEIAPINNQDSYFNQILSTFNFTQ